MKTDNCGWSQAATRLPERYRGRTGAGRISAFRTPTLPDTACTTSASTTSDKSGSSRARRLCRSRSLCMPRTTPIERQLNFRRLTDASAKQPAVFVRCIANDQGRRVVDRGTNKGVAVIYNPGGVFQLDELRRAEGDHPAGRLQSAVSARIGYVTAIAIDGAGRWWFGTYSAARFRCRPTAPKQLLASARVTFPACSRHRPLVAVDGGVTGKYSSGTDKGIIVSYRGDATEGSETCSDYNVFPNPVRHDWRISRSPAGGRCRRPYHRCDRQRGFHTRPGRTDRLER